MDKELIENINKVSFLNEKLQTIERAYANEQYSSCYELIFALFELVAIMVLKRKYNKKVEDSDIAVLASMLEVRGEIPMRDILVEVNGELEDIELEEVQDIHVLSLVSKLDDLVGTVLEKYGDIIS